MVKKRSSIILIIIGLIIFSSVVVSAQDTSWVVEINGKKYSYDDFVMKFNIFIELTAPRDQWDKLKKDKKMMKDYLEVYINEIILWDRVKRDKYDTQNTRLLNFTRQQVIINLYIMKVVYEGLKEPTDDEIATFYDNNKDKFKGVKLETAAAQIREYLKQQKLQAEIKRRIEKIKENITIQRNPDYFEKGQKTSWVIKIGDVIITYDEFTGLLEDYKQKIRDSGQGAILDQQPVLFLQDFTNNYINNYLMYNYEIKKTDFEKKFSAQIDYLYQRQVMELYVQEKLKGQIKPVSQEQIRQYYETYKSKFANMSPEQAYQYIGQMLNMQLYQTMVNNLVQQYRDEYLIKKNYSISFLQE